VSNLIQVCEAPNISMDKIVCQCNVFLAGPILGTWDWQDAAIKLIKASYEDDLPSTIFNPRRSSFKDLKDFDETTFNEQVDWEHKNLQNAQDHGIIMFWLANKTIDMPHRNYALTTLFELGEFFKGNRDNDRARVVVGIEPGFTNEQYLRRTISKKSKFVPIFSTLEETCKYVADNIC
jgi:hypothetical protein